MGQGIFALFVVVAACIVIWMACDYFEDGSRYLGRNMPPGVRGATINAVGSSLPELLTTFCLLFLFRDQDGFSAGIATCAGSAVFNAVIIPALVILVAPLVPGEKFSLDRATVLRDGIFFLIAEAVLIIFLGHSVLTWQMGAALLMLYLGYALYLSGQVHKPDPVVLSERASREETTERVVAREEAPTVPFVARPEMTWFRAWKLLIVSTFVIGVACYGLSWAVLAIAKWWQVPVYFTAVVFAAAATSVPDTILSIKDAQVGDFDDAIANAIGSNIFDITVCLGLPLVAYGLVYGDVHLSAAAGSAANVQGLRIALFGVTLIVLTLFLWGKMGKTKGVFLLGLYGLWMAYLANQAWG